MMKPSRMLYHSRSGYLSLSKCKPQMQSSKPRFSFGKHQDSNQSLKTTFTRKGPVAKSSQTPKKWKTGKKFWDLTFLYAMGGRHIRAVLELLAGPWGRGLYSGGSLIGLPGSVPSPPTCFWGTSTVPFLWLRVCEGSGTSGRNGHDVGKGCCGGG